jgi:hypothetical protein
MDERDLRDPEAERRSFWRHGMAIAGVAIVVTAAIAVSLEATRQNDHHYSFFMSYGTANGAIFTVLLPLPSDPDIRSSLRVATNVSYSTETSPHGLVLRVYGQQNATLYAFLDTWKNLDVAFTTEGTSAQGRPAVRVFLDTDGVAAGSFVRVVFTKVDASWTQERTARGDAFEGWNTLEIQETLTKTARA